MRTLLLALVLAGAPMAGVVSVGVGSVVSTVAAGQPGGSDCVLDCPPPHPNVVHPNVVGRGAGAA